MRIFFVLLLAGSLLGCGYRQAMQRGQAATERKDFAAAVDAYQDALRADPDDPRAAERLVEARRLWHAQALARFERSLAEGDLAGARGAIAEADRARPGERSTTIAQERLTTAKNARAGRALRANAKTAEGKGDGRAAYRLYAKAERLHRTQEGQAALDRVRAGLVARARAEEGAGRFAEALALWEVLAQVEAEKHASDRDAQRQRWAERLRSQGASAVSAQRIGEAFLYYAQAAALSGSAADAVERDRLRAEVLADTALVVVPAVEGPTEFKARIAQALDGLPSAVAAGRAPQLAVHVRALPLRCVDHDQDTVAEERYQSGTRTLRNPRWREARRRVRDARRDLRQAEEEADRRRDEALRLEDRVERKQRRWLEEQDRRRSQAQRDLDRAREAEQRAYDGLREAQGRNDQSATRRCQSDVERARRDVDRAWRSMQTIGRGTFSAHQELQRERERWARARQEVAQRRDRLDDAERALDGEEPTVLEPVYALHRYVVTRWTRACVGPMKLSVRAGDLPPTESVVERDATTRDAAHAAQVPLGLDADPLAFPKPRATLQAEVNEALAAAAVEAATAQARAWAQTLGDRAAAADSPAEAARLAAASVLLSPQGPTQAVKRLLAERFGVRDFGVLLAEGR